MAHINRDYQAFLDDTNLVVIEAFIDSHNFFIVDELNNRLNYNLVSKKQIKNLFIYTLQLAQNYDYSKEYFVHSQNGLMSIIKERKVVRTTAFDNDFFYGGQLGNFYSKEKTLFKLWAPICKQVKLLLTNPKTNKTITYDMNRIDKGIYTVEVSGDLEGYNYLYLIKNHGTWKECVDPYAKSSLINSKASCIIDLAKTNIDLSGEIDHLPINESVIYEVHVRDFSINPKFEFKNKGKFLAFTETGLKNDFKDKIGIDYIKDLGITHIQFLPIYDFSSVSEFDYDNSYNWGYDPEQYNVVEGRYATDPYDCYNRIIELKQMIKYLKKQNIGVIMDVVYNHIYNTSNFAFQKLIPGYYLRMHKNETLYSSSGTGNDVASEHRMVRKYIVDSICYWLSEFKLNGFRFDLMGLLDIETLEEISFKLKQINPNVYLYGEGWLMPSTLNDEDMANIYNAKKLPEYGFFNDVFRDSIKGSRTQMKEAGLASGNPNLKNKAKDILLGHVDSMFITPSQSVNYVSCHDDHILYDRLAFLTKNEKKILSYQKLCYSFTILSQGVSLIHFGCEFSRSKNGISNTYNLGDNINQIDWNQVTTNENLVNYVKALIKLKKEIKALTINDPNIIKQHMSVTINNDLIIYSIKNIKAFIKNSKYNNLIILFNVENKKTHFKPTNCNKEIILNNDLTLKAINKNEISINPYSIKILTSINKLFLNQY